MKMILPPRGIGRAMIWMLVLATFTLGWRPLDSMAMLIPASSNPVESSSESDRTADLQHIQTILESKVVQQRLADFGLTPEEIDAKLSRLSNGQLHELATNIDAVIPAGDGLGIVIALLVIAILAVILVYLLDHRIVITKNGSNK